MVKIKFSNDRRLGDSLSEHPAFLRFFANASGLSGNLNNAANIGLRN